MSTSRSAKSRLGQRASLAVALVGVLGAAACSSGQASSPSAAGGQDTTATAQSSGGANLTGAGSTASCMSKANSFLKPWDTLPKSLSPVYTPLRKKPAPGGTIIRLVGPVSSDHDSAVALQTAAASIRWTAKAIYYDGSVQDLNAKFEQAIAEKPTVITVSGQPTSTIIQSLKDAKSAGIVVSLDNILDQPTSNPGFAGVAASTPTAQMIGELNAYMFMRDSGCTGQVAVFNLPFPILDQETATFAKTVAAECPNCKISQNYLQIDELATPAATNAILSALQSSPATKYVYAVISEVGVGLRAALGAASLTGIKIFGSTPDANALQSLRDKTSAWWIDESPIIDGWTELDAALRAIQSGGTVTDRGGYPLAVLTPQNVGTGDDPTYPADYQSEFKKLWLEG